MESTDAYLTWFRSEAAALPAADRRAVLAALENRSARDVFTKEGVTAVELAGTEVVAAIPRSEQLKKHGKDPHARQKGDTDQYASFRARMAEAEYKDLHRLRPSMAEFPNADCRNRNLRQFRVRGLMKVKAVALWHALAFNFLRMLNLGALAV
jgi:hypothetical protein